MQKDNNNTNGRKTIMISEEPEVVVTYDREDPMDISSFLGKWRRLQRALQQATRDYLVYRQETQELVKKRKIAGDTNSQLVSARSQGVQDAYDFRLGTEKELVLSDLKERLDSDLMDSKIRRSMNKWAAINEAAAAFEDEKSRMSPDLQNHCGDIVQSGSLEVFAELIYDIVHADSDVREVIRKNCPRKKRTLLGSIFRSDL